MSKYYLLTQLEKKKVVVNISLVALWVIALLNALSSDATNYAHAALGVSMYADDKRFLRGAWETTDGTTYPGTSVAIELISMSLSGSSALNPGQSELPPSENSVDGKNLFDLSMELSVDGDNFTLNSPFEMTYLLSNTGKGIISNTSRPSGEWEKELLSMSITAEHPTLGPITLRESPSATSLGKYSITDFGDGTGELESFFDIWTEVQVGDSSQPFYPSTSALRLNLTRMVPEPSSAILLCVGLAVLGIYRQRRP